MSSNKILALSIVRFTNGDVDPIATEANYSEKLVADATTRIATFTEKLTKEIGELSGTFAADLEEYVRERGTFDALSHQAISEVYARFPDTEGGSIGKASLVSLASNQMLSNGQIKFEQLPYAAKMVASFIDDNEGELFTVTAGRNGGVRRNAVKAAE